MGLFNFFKKNEEKDVNLIEEDNTSIPPKEIFIEEKEPEQIQQNQQSGLSKIYEYSETDFEEKGFNDALTNPDFSYSEDNIKLLKYDLQILIQKAFHLYEDSILDLDFHIETRGRAGLIDTVKQLETQKAKVASKIKKVEDIDKDYNNNTGLGERIELSYKRGFMRGLAAISDQILTKN